MCDQCNPGSSELVKNKMNATSAAPSLFGYDAASGSAIPAQLAYCTPHGFNITTDENGTTGAGTGQLFLPYIPAFE